MRRGRREAGRAVERRATANCLTKNGLGLAFATTETRGHGLSPTIRHRPNAATQGRGHLARCTADGATARGAARLSNGRAEKGSDGCMRAISAKRSRLSPSF